MNLIVDIGNSRVKVAVVEQGEVLRLNQYDSVAAIDFDSIVASLGEQPRAIVASTAEDATTVVQRLQALGVDTIKMDSEVGVPIGNDYLSPQSLGVDRLAAAVGAVEVTGNENCLVVDFGTAITIDVVEGGIFRGGNISPGVRSRFRALHDYTRRLPMCEPTDEVLELGRTTTEAIEQGIMQGIAYEIEGYVERYLCKDVKFSIIFTGGDAKYFVKRIKNAIFADCELVICGLNRILDYNAKIEQVNN